MKFSKLIFSLTIIILIVAVSPAHSQCPPVYIFNGEAAGDRFGVSVASAGDVNGDGFDDLIVGAPINDAGGTSAGRAYVFSGQTGDTLYVFTGEAVSDYFGSSVASAGDVNNDGFDDLIVGAYLNSAGGILAGRAYVFSGLNGDTLYVFTGEAKVRFGISVASAGDVNNDGFDDLIVGAAHHPAAGTRTGRAYVFSGQTGETFYTFTGEAAGDRFGHSVASAGDVNNDGFDDLIVGAAGNDAGGNNAGRAYVFSGLNGDTLYVFTGEAGGDVFGDSFGFSVASAGDVNNDGFDDIIVGALRNDAGGLEAGRAYVFSGLNGDTIYVFTGEGRGDEFGISVASAGDVNNDGFADLIVGAQGNDAGGFNAGQAYVFSGQTGNTIYVFTGEAPSDLFGNSVASASDVDNDGFDDLIVGAFLSDAGGDRAGRAYVYLGTCFICADANGDSLINFEDVDFLMNFYFYGGGTPFPYLASDLNCDGSVDIADITYLAAYINGTGAPPCCQ